MTTVYSIEKIAAESLTELFSEFEQGTITSAAEVCGYLAFFRQTGVCRLLAAGVPDALCTSQQQAASGYLFRLKSLDPDDPSTSHREGRPVDQAQVHRTYSRRQNQSY